MPRCYFMPWRNATPDSRISRGVYYLSLFKAKSPDLFQGRGLIFKSGDVLLSHTATV